MIDQEPVFWIVAAEVGISINVTSERVYVNGYGVQNSIYIPKVKTPMEMATRIWLAVQTCESAEKRKAFDERDRSKTTT